jgi:hypothetical protein
MAAYIAVSISNEIQLKVKYSLLILVLDSNKPVNKTGTCDYEN